MAKRTAPLLYIYQPKEIVVEAEQQEFYYAKKETKKKRKEEERVDDVYEEDREDVEGIEEGKDDERDILEKLKRIQTYSTLFEPTIEIETKEETYVGTLKKIEEGTVVLYTRKAPYTVECAIADIQSVKIISL